jgi:ABC-type antimicrobial peptide transport system permease subunit
MFISYLTKELRRRWKQAVVVSLGLELGIALVVTVSAMASGVSDAQNTVLHSLYGVGTDISVTQNDASNGPPGGFNVGGDGSTATFSRDRVSSIPGLATMSVAAATKIANLPDVAAAAGGLRLNSTHLSGRLPTIPPAASFGSSSGAPAQQANPGKIDISSVSIVGVDVSTTSVGPLDGSQITSGRSLDATDASAKVAVVDRTYAKSHSLSVGDTLTIAAKDYRIVGIAAAPASGTSTQVYLPLAAAQSLAGVGHVVNTIYVKATSAATIAAAKQEIKEIYPKANVITASDLAKQVTGSLASASNLATKLGSWLSIAVLLAAVVIASLLTISAVGRRTRELGTLKALGWRTPRVVVQVVGEALTQGVIGGGIGLGLGVIGAWLVTRAMPALSATVSSDGGAVPGGGPQVVAGGQNPFTHTISVALHAPVDLRLAGLAIALSLAGGLTAGLLGGWRAARLRPADSMRQLV